MSVLFTFYLLQLPPPSSPVINKDSNNIIENLFELKVLIPIICGIIGTLFLFIVIFKYCNKERSNSLVNIIDKINSIFRKKKASKSITNDAEISKIPNLVFRKS